MSYLPHLRTLRNKMLESSTKQVQEDSPDSLVPVRAEQTPQPTSEELVDRTARWLSQVRQASAEIKQKTAPPKSGGFADGFQSSFRITKKSEEAEEQKEGFIERRKDNSPSSYAPKRPNEEDSVGERPHLKEAPDKAPPGYGDISQKSLENIIRQEASARNMDPDIAVAIFRSEGAGNYQSQVVRKGKGAYDGKEDSYGPYQLYRGGGLGNVYEKKTGRNLREDNTEEGITNQIRFALDAAVDQGWTPWYGRKHAGVGPKDGLSGARKLGNWK